MTNPIENDPWLARLSEYVDGGLSPAEVEALELHLRTCERCSTALRDLTVVVDTLRRESVATISRAYTERAWPQVLAQLSASRGYSHDVLGSGRSWLVHLIGAALIMGVGLLAGYWMGLAACGRRPSWPGPSWLHLGTASAPATQQRSLVRADVGNEIAATSGNKKNALGERVGLF